MWDTLTSSLCAIVHDNLPLELLNQPFHIEPEVSPLADRAAVTPQGDGDGNGNEASSSPAWVDTARASSDEVCSAVACLAWKSLGEIEEWLGGTSSCCCAE